jgi:hypothetical protein
MSIWVKRDTSGESGWYKGTSGRVQTKVNGIWRISPITVVPEGTQISVFVKKAGVWKNTLLTDP